jgi:hypothetical protein
MKPVIIWLLLLVSVSAISHSIGIGALPAEGGTANDPNSVHKWELWDSDINITGTERAPIMKTGDTDFPEELLAAGVDSFFTGLISLTNSTKYGLSSIIISNEPANPTPSGTFLNYGEHIGGGGADVLSVWRLCNITQSGFCNTGPLMALGDLSNTLFPSAAMSVSSDAPDSSQILRLNGYFMDTGQMIYLANTANVKAINAENGDLVCTNLNADMVDSFHLDQDVSTTGGPSFAGNVSAQYFIGDGSALTNLPTPDLSGYVPYDGGTSNFTLTGYNITSDYFIGDGSLLTNLPVPTTVANSTYSNDSDMLDSHHWSEIITTKINNATYSDNSDTVDLKHAYDFLWLDGSKTMLGDLNMGVYSVTAPSSLSMKVSNGENFLVLNETGDIRAIISDEGKLFLTDFQKSYGDGEYIALMHYGGNSYIGGTGGLLLDPANGNVYIGSPGIGTITAPRVYELTTSNQPNVYVDSSGNLARSTINISNIKVNNATFADTSNNTLNFNGYNSNYYLNTSYAPPTSGFNDTGLLYQNGTRPLTGNWNTGDYNITLPLINVEYLNLDTTYTASVNITHAIQNVYDATFNSPYGQTFKTIVSSLSLNVTTIQLCLSYVSGGNLTICLYDDCNGNSLGCKLIATTDMNEGNSCPYGNYFNVTFDSPISVESDTTYYIDTSTSGIWTFGRSTSDLYADGYLDTSDAGKCAQSTNYGDLNFTIYGIEYGNTKASVLHSANSLGELINSTLLPTSTNFYNMGSASAYWKNVYASQYYAKNTTIVAFDDYKDAELIKSITQINDVGNKYFDMPKVLFDKFNDTREIFVVNNGRLIKMNSTIESESLNLGKVHGLEIGTLKELILRSEYLESENQKLKEQLATICKENNLKGCAT